MSLIKRMDRFISVEKSPIGQVAELIMYGSK